MNLLAALALLATQAAEPAPYSAIGARPLWQAAIHPDAMTFETHGRDRVSVDTPARQDNANGFVYRTDQLVIAVTHGACTDALTHRVYADRVTVQNGGTIYEGCGGGARGWNRPAPYGAAGGEPFWDLEIADGRLYFGVNDEVVIVPVPRMVATRDLRTRHYSAPGIMVTLREENCELEDERTYADTVTIRAGHWTVEGCGGRLVREAPGE